MGSSGQLTPLLVSLLPRGSHAGQWHPTRRAWTFGPHRHTGPRRLGHSSRRQESLSCDVRHPNCVRLIPMTTQTSAAIDSRYAQMTDQRLATMLATEDREEYAGLNPFERVTCHVHRRWLHDCVASPVHVNMISGHRWCRHCETATAVSVDHLSGSVTVLCPRCRCSPNTLATRQIIRACKASLAAAREA